MTVTNLTGMFKNQINLTSITAWAIDTSGVNYYMKDLFYGCASLTSLNLSGIDTTNTRDMSNMFYGCSALTSLDVSGFDTSNARTMSGMFSHCSNLSSLDVSGFDTSNVTDMSYMFYGTDLSSADLTDIKMTRCSNAVYMFGGCNSLTSVRLPAVSNDMRMLGMFLNCSSLSSFDMTGTFPMATTSTASMFSGCSSLTTLDLSDFFIQKAVSCSTAAMFSGCSSLATLDVRRLYECYTRLSDLSGMFGGNTGLNEVILGKAGTDSEFTAQILTACESQRTPAAGYSWKAYETTDGRDTVVGVVEDQNE